MTYFYDNEADAQKHAAELRADGHRDAYVKHRHINDDFTVEHGPVDLSVAIPKRGDGRWLFALRIGGYSIRCWDTYSTMGSMGHTRAGVVATRNGKIVFLTDQIGLSPAYGVDGPQARAGVVGWVAHDLNDDNLSCEREMRFGEGS